MTKLQAKRFYHFHITWTNVNQVNCYTCTKKKKIIQCKCLRSFLIIVCILPIWVFTTHLITLFSTILWADFLFSRQLDWNEIIYSSTCQETFSIPHAIKLHAEVIDLENHISFDYVSIAAPTSAWIQVLVWTIMWIWFYYLRYSQWNVRKC